MIKTKLLVPAVALFALAGCQTNGDMYRSDVYGSNQVNQAQQRVTRAQVNLNSASAAYGAAQSTANGAQAALTSAQNSASAQQAAVSGAQAKADAASATVDSAQQVLQASQQNKPTSSAMTQTRQDIASQGDQLQSDQTALDAALKCQIKLERN